MSRCFYHYCSLDTFIAIISNKSLRLCDLSKTNDYMERKWILTILEDSLIKAFEKNEISINLKEDYCYDKGIHNHLAFTIICLNIMLRVQVILRFFQEMDIY